MSPAALPLRDIHIPPAPPWWPPAAGWWVLAALMLAGCLLLVWLAWRRRARRRRLEQLFDRSVAAADGPAAQVAAISILLRRAARTRNPAAATARGADWLALLASGPDEPAFDEAASQLLLEGPFRKQVDPGAVDALRIAARARFLALLGGR